MPYYAVKVGKTPGVYNTWTECEANIKGIDKAVFKKFDSESDAKSFINSNNPLQKANDVAKKNAINNILEAVKKSKLEQDNVAKELEEKSSQVVDDSFDFVNSINIYVYGLTINDSSETPTGSIGIFFSDDDLRNSGNKIVSGLDEKNGKKRMELKAVLVGLSKVIDSVVETGEIVVIHTDSVYAIKCFTQDITKNIDSRHVPNFDYISKGFNTINMYPQIKFHYVKNINSLKSPGAYGVGNAKKLASDRLIEDIEHIQFKFGKYKDKTFAEIYSDDIEYFDWCLLNCQTQLTEIKLFMDSKNF